jgi:hypothetical protein
MTIKKNLINAYFFRNKFSRYGYSLSISMLISFTLLISSAYGLVLSDTNSNLILQIPSLSSSSNSTGDHMIMNQSQMDHMIMNQSQMDHMIMNMNMNMNMNQSEMLKRGDIAMEFNQSKISHQFVITPSGGEIKISALDSNDNQTISQIKDHVENIHIEFSAGDFNRSSFIHDTIVPGTDVMTDKKDLIDYSIVEMNNGSSLILKTNDTEVIDAVSKFMEFQAIEHRGH